MEGLRAGIFSVSLVHFGLSHWVTDLMSILVFLDHGGDMVFVQVPLVSSPSLPVCCNRWVGLAQSQAPNLRVSKSPFYVFLLGVSQDAFETAK